MRPAVPPLLLCALAAVAGRLGASFTMWLEPAVPVVEYGKSVLLKVKSTCSDPNGRGGVETSTLKRFLTNTPEETVAELQNVTTLNSKIIYFYDCNGRKKNSTDLIVYRVPERPVLKPPEWLPVGREQELNCRVKDAAPIRNLTVTLRRGDEVLRGETFENRNPDELETVTVTHRLTARREDHGRDIACEALLDLQPYGQRFSVTSEPQPLSVYEFPEGPEMEPDIHLEVNETANINCTVGRVFPEARFTLALAGQTLPFVGDGHRATATVSRGEPGRFRLLCNVTVGPAEKRTEATVHVYRFPEPRLNVSAATVEAGANVTGFCDLPPERSDELRLRVLAGGRVLNESGPSRLPFEFTARKEDDGVELRCEATIPRTGKARKNATIRLNVTAKPWMDDESCPPQQNWTEGQDETLRCQARGNPRPRLECAKDGVPFPAGVPRPVTRAHAGTYRCWATNTLGTAERAVAVWVHYHDPDLVLLVLVPALVAAALLAAGVSYGIYYRKKKIREYRLQQRQREQQQLVMKQKQPPASSPAVNGSAP